MARKRLTARQRRTRGFKPPLGVAQSYASAIRDLLDVLERKALEHVLAGWESNRVAFSGQLPVSQSRFDASQFVGTTIGGMLLELEEVLDPTTLAGVLAKFAKRIETKNGAEFKRVVGISNQDTGLKTALDTFQNRNVSLVKSLAQTQIQNFRSLLEQAEVNAWRVEQLQAQIQASFSVSKSKANLLARDQVLKLNGQLTQTRQQNAGITKYIWTTAGDERVRPVHDELDGTVQRWDRPPVISKDGRTGHPGDDYQCRCTAFPYLEELDG